MPPLFNHELLVRVRTEHGLTQEQAARLAGVDVRTYRRYESGEVNERGTFAVRKASRRLIVDRLCNELGIPEEELVRDVNHAPTNGVSGSDDVHVGATPHNSQDARPSTSARVFVSYSGDSNEHRTAVDSLAISLRSWGAQVSIDIGVEQPARGWAQWTMSQFSEADVILMICTPAYRRRIEQREVPGPGWGATWEGALLTDLVYDGTHAFGRIGVVLLEGTTEDAIPMGFRAAPRYSIPEDAENLRAWLARPLRKRRLLEGVDGAPADRTDDELQLYANPEERAIAAYLRDLEALGELDLSPQNSDARQQLTDQINEVRRRLRFGPSLNPGQTLDGGSYTLVRRLGIGGFGTVWLARDSKVRREVAIKVLKVEHQDERTRKARFFRGARVMASFNHPNIVKVFDAGRVDGGHHYFVMEYVKGGDLQTWMKVQKPELPAIFSVIRRIADALQAAHRRGVVHRDVKPSNILVGDDSPQLTDFDLVQAPDSIGGTQAEPMGTYLYSSPEVLTDPSSADARSDIYSLGMTLLFCLTGGALPITSKHDVARVLETTRTPVALKSLVIRATAADPSERPGTMSALIAELVEVEHAFTLQAPSSAAPRPPYPMLRSLSGSEEQFPMIAVQVVVGRSPRSDLSLQRPFVSAHHAIIRWTGHMWMIQDLGSRNGTFVDQRRLSPGEHARLVEDSVVAFGNKLEAWRVVAAQSPPDIVALNEATGEVRVATDGMLTLSDDHDVALFLGPGGWLCEREDGIGSVVDGGILNLGANRWVLRVNGRSEGTTTATLGYELVLAAIELVLYVSRDEEFVRVALKTADRTIELGARAHNYLLLTLARQRLSDLRDGLSEASGWIGMAECARVVGDGARLNIDVFRVRSQFLAVGVKDGGSIIERLPRDRQIRIGTSRLSIVSS